VGTDARANGLGASHYWVALQNVQDADLDVRTTADRSTMALADTVTFTTVLSNHGPASANTVTVQAPLPPGFTLVGATPGKGTYSGTSGAWTVGGLTSAEVTTLQLTAIAGLGSVAQTLAHKAKASEISPLDIYDGNSVDSAWVHVTGADISVTAGTNDLTPTVGVAADFSMDVSNTGTDAVTSLVVKDSLAGFARGAATVSQGTFDPATGLWTIGALATGQVATLRYAAAPNAGTEGTTIQRVARVVSSSLPDPDPADDAVVLDLKVMAPVALIRSGTYVGNGAARTITGVGFQPDLLIIKGAGTSVPVARTRAMASDAAKELSLANALVTGRVTGLTADGFSVGTDATVNAAGVVYHWTAFIEAPGQMRIGSYLGDGVDNRGLTGVGFQPDYMMVLGATTRHAVQRFPAQAGDNTNAFESGAEITNRIQRLDPDGFQVGSDSDVNGAGTTYHYACWNAAAAVAGGGAYAGDGTDDRNVDTLYFQPSVALVARRDNGSGTVFRTPTLTGDASLTLFAGAQLANAIQLMRPGGFQIGSDGSVNTANKSYLYFGVRDATGADLVVNAVLLGPVPDEGDTLKIGITVKNQGPETATSVAVSNPIPPGTAFTQSIPTQGTYNPLDGQWTVGTLAPGATAGIALSMVVGIGMAGSTVTSIATGTANPADPYSGQQRGHGGRPGWRRGPRLDLKRDDATPTQNEEVVFTLKVTNPSTFNAPGVQVHALLPPALSYHSHTTAAGTYTPADGTWALGTLAAGATATLTIKAASASAPGTVAAFIANIAASGKVDPVADNNADTTSITVQRPEFRIVTGRYTGDGTGSRTIGGVGFQPDLLIIKGEGATATVVRMKGMPDDRAKPLGEATALVSGRVTCFTPDGFVLGGDASVNAAGTNYYWTAYLEMAGEMKVGSYVGDAVDNRNITGLGFQPGYLILTSELAKSAVQRFGGEVGDASLVFSSATEAKDRIQGFQADGFQIGGSTDINTAGAVHYYAGLERCASARPQWTLSRQRRRRTHRRRPRIPPRRGPDQAARQPAGRASARVGQRRSDITGAGRRGVRGRYQRPSSPTASSWVPMLPSTPAAR
jgi:uncharacterized repeat protein (TIGR01451 family)